MKVNTDKYISDCKNDCFFLPSDLGKKYKNIFQKLNYSSFKTIGFWRMEKPHKKIKNRIKIN